MSIEEVTNKIKLEESMRSLSLNEKIENEIELEKKRRDYRINFINNISSGRILNNYVDDYVDDYVD